MAANGISTLEFKRDRVIAKLELANAKRPELAYDLTLLPTVPGIDSNLPEDIVNNPNVGGLQPGRPWVISIPTPTLFLDATDYSGSGATWTAAEGDDATLFNSPTYALGPPGGSPFFTFDRALAQYATVPDIGSLDHWTVEAWFRLDTALNTGSTDITAVVCNEFDGNNLNFSIGTNRQPSSANISVGFYNGVWRTTAGFVPNTGEWYNVVGTYDGSTIRQYVNGVEQSTFSYSGTPVSGGDVRIARRWDDSTSAGNLFPGDISLVRIWNSALTQSQIAENFNDRSSTYGL